MRLLLLLLFLLFLVDHFQRPNCTVRWPLLLFLLFLLLWFLVNVSGIGKIIDFQNHFWRMFQVLGLVVGKDAFWRVMILLRRELRFEQKWAYYLGETRTPRHPLPTIILYIEYIVCSTTTTIISSGRRREYLPARGHTTDWDLTPTPWEECTSSQRVARHLPNPTIPPYYIKTPHCMEPRRWRIHIYALAGFFEKVP